MKLIHYIQRIILMLNDEIILGMLGLGERDFDLLQGITLKQIILIESFGLLMNDIIFIETILHDHILCLLVLMMLLERSLIIKYLSLLIFIMKMNIIMNDVLMNLI
jgi:hypothetical protein